MDDLIVGIDLGTTNSEIAAFVDGEVRVLADAGDEQIMPSCVGLSTSGELLVGTAARNQYLLYPERTVKSIKRKMGTSEQIKLGDRVMTPPEISALILRELKRRAEARLGVPVRRAIITVPAYFTDLQRQATRDAGEVAGLEVVRILNEPTAAALAYGSDREDDRMLLVYDLGGGTFDVSIVQISGDVTEVIASSGDTHLGGDDFDQLLLGHVLAGLSRTERAAVEAEPTAMSRLTHAVEEAKKQLSFQPHAMIREEYLTKIEGTPFHLERELDRASYESAITHLVDRTLASINRALTDARKSAADIDGILLAGGATRTPLISEMLESRFGLLPHQDVHPDLCVALGAGVLAARQSGHQLERVLVDISPYSFGPSYLGEKDGDLYTHCYRPVIRRNSPLPASRTESYHTVHDGQDAVDLQIFQGDDPDALNDILVGEFRIEGLADAPAGNEILCRMDLDLDGILRVTAIEKATGLSRQVVIERATTALSDDEIRASRARLASLIAGDDEDLEEDLDEDLDEDLRDRAGEPASSRFEAARAVLTRSRAALSAMNPDDREEAIGLHESLEAAMEQGKDDEVTRLAGELTDLLFYVEAR
jgi:molecular chaperone DnaK (HSP70)